MHSMTALLFVHLVVSAACAPAQPPVDRDEKRERLPEAPSGPTASASITAPSSSASDDAATAATASASTSAEDCHAKPWPSFAPALSPNPSNTSAALPVPAGQEAFSACVVAVVRSKSFEPPAEGSETVVIPIEFTR